MITPSEHEPGGWEFTPSEPLRYDYSVMRSSRSPEKPVSPKSRRLAVIDTRFPWRLSGFRYWECDEMYRQRPDTLFFATTPLPDPFPTSVHHFRDFPTLAVSAGITDVYCVFLNLAASLLGCTSTDSGSRIAGSEPALDISGLIEKLELRLHATFYPGGGLEPTTAPETIRKVGARCETVFTNLPEVFDVLPEALYDPGPINTDFYSYNTRPLSLPIVITYCHARAPRKNFPMMAEAFNQLDDTFHLNLVGDWDSELHKLTNPRYTFYGLVDPERLIEIYRGSHVFLECSSEDSKSMEGFPTTSGAEALSTGCVLIARNYRKDYRTLRSRHDYLEIEDGDAKSIVERLIWVRDHLPDALQTAARGAQSIRALFHCRAGVKRKLAAIFK